MIASRSRRFETPGQFSRARSFFEKRERNLSERYNSAAMRRLTNSHVIYKREVLVRLNVNVKLGLREREEGREKGTVRETSEREEKSKKETSEKIQYDNAAAVIKGRIASDSTWETRETQEIRTFDRQTKRHVIVVSSYSITPKSRRTIFVLDTS